MELCADCGLDKQGIIRKEGAAPAAPSPLSEVNIIGRSKYNVSDSPESRTYEGIVFDSKVEMKYYRDVVLPLVGSGNIVKCELQKPYILQPKFTRNGKTIIAIKYVADFCLEFSDGHIEVIDIKGMPDSVAKLKRKLFWYVYPNIDYKWVCWSKVDGGWCDYDIVTKNRQNRKRVKRENVDGEE